MSSWRSKPSSRTRQDQWQYATARSSELAEPYVPNFMVSNEFGFADLDPHEIDHCIDETKHPYQKSHRRRQHDVDPPPFSRHKPRGGFHAAKDHVAASMACLDPSSAYDIPAGPRSAYHTGSAPAVFGYPEDIRKSIPIRDQRYGTAASNEALKIHVTDDPMWGASLPWEASTNSRYKTPRERPYVPEYVGDATSPFVNNASSSLSSDVRYYGEVGSKTSALPVRLKDLTGSEISKSNDSPLSGSFESTGRPSAGTDSDERLPSDQKPRRRRRSLLPGEREAVGLKRTSRTVCDNCRKRKVKCDRASADDPPCPLPRSRASSFTSNTTAPLSRNSRSTQQSPLLSATTTPSFDMTPSISSSLETHLSTLDDLQDPLDFASLGGTWTSPIYAIHEEDDCCEDLSFQPLPPPRSAPDNYY